MSQNYQPYAEYKDSGVEWLGDIPGHWSCYPIKYLATMKSGESITSENIKIEGAFPVYGGNGFRGYTDDYTHHGDFVLVGRQGALCGNINYGYGQFWASEHALVVTALKKGVNVYWLGELLRSMNLNQYSITAAQPGLSAEALVNLRIPVPPQPERDAIAAFLDHETARIDQLIAKQQRLIELLKEKRQAVISHAVTKGLNPNAPMKDSGVEWLGEVPEHWEVKRLKHISPKIGVGLVINPSTYVADEGVYFLFGGDVTEYGFKLSTTRRMSISNSNKLVQSRLNSGDLVCVRVGYPGVTAVVTEELDGANCASMMVIRKGQYDSHWLAFCLNSEIGKQQVQKVQYGAAQKQYNIADAIEFVFPVPPKVEQFHIHNFLMNQSETLNRLTKKSQDKIVLLQERRTALISAAVTGKIDLRGWQASAGPAKSGQASAKWPLVAENPAEYGEQP